MSKSDLLKNGMKSGLDGLLSSTRKPPQKQETAAQVKPAKAAKEPAVHCNFVIDKSIHTRMRFLAIEKGMSLKDMVNEAMTEYLEKNGK
ncbi:hypothetical protein [uncultured Bacteroides sp.]|mgnify:CR=1 FL=1|uniref:hypothetical protein n=1 Tax=uncultured Bacteroides sp. TaxID=162156 RepID=UPI0025DAD6F5|nr:hypothetical protein [uncultured Bacteroides sp.]